MNASSDASSRRSRSSWLAVWSVTSLILGIAASFIPWGSPSTLHGKGFPVFIIAWDRSPTSGQFLDYPNPLGYVLDPLLVFLAGIMVRLLVRLVSFLRHRSSSSTVSA